MKAVSGFVKGKGVDYEVQSTERKKIKFALFGI
jgi:hypothetical protein